MKYVDLMVPEMKQRNDIKKLNHLSSQAFKAGDPKGIAVLW